MEPSVVVAIKEELLNCVANTLHRMSREPTNAPFHAALLSKTAVKWSRFERSFSTSFGQRCVQEVSRLVSVAGGASAAQTLRQTSCKVSQKILGQIERHISQCRQGTLPRGRSWKDDLDDCLREVGNGDMVDVRVISDLWFVRNGINHYFSIKTVKPNIDQTAEAKRDLLKLKAHDPDCRPFFGLYYNPYGEQRRDYAWAPPQALFNMREDGCVLIGKDYWDYLGGSGTYEEVLDIAGQVGETTRAAIGD